MFGRRRPLFQAPAGLNTTPQRVMLRVPFVYDSTNVPAFEQGKLDKLAKEPQHDKLLKGQMAGWDALKGLGLRGLRMQVIVLLDGSGSMLHDYQSGKVQKMLVRALGFTLNVDTDGEIPVIVYGRSVNKPVIISTKNYLQAGDLIQPDFGSTAMTEALEAAIEMAIGYNMLTLIVNITDGNPNHRVSMSNAAIKTSGYPFMLTNLALRPVDYLTELDKLPSQIEVVKNENTDEVVRDANGALVLERNPAGIRLIDNVSSQAIDPTTATDEQFATAMTVETGTCIEVMGQVGTLTGVPGVTQTITV